MLVWHAPTMTMNPTVSDRLIQVELKNDPDTARAEWLPGFRDDLESAFSREAIEACVLKDRDELPSSPAAYHGFVDPSGGRHDAFTLAIAHKPRDRVVVDLIEKTGESNERDGKYVYPMLNYKLANFLNRRR